MPISKRGFLRRLWKCMDSDGLTDMMWCAGLDSVKQTDSGRLTFNDGETV